VGRERTIESFRGFFTVIGDELASMIVFTVRSRRSLIPYVVFKRAGSKNWW
jgi:hypothetical protein